MHFVGYLIAFVAGVFWGFWLHYKFGARLANEVNQIRQLKP